MNSAGRDRYAAGIVTLTRPEFSAAAAGAGPANFWFTASAMRAEVVKSDWRNCSRTTSCGSTEGAARSTIALLGARPTVG